MASGHNITMQDIHVFCSVSSSTVATQHFEYPLLEGY